MEATTFPDERLELLFTCCHPALSTEAQVALTLRTLGGLTTPEIAALRAEQPTDWPQIAALYGELSRLTRSPVVELNRAVAVAEAEGPEAGLAIIAGLDLDGYLYLHSTRGELLRRLGRDAEAGEAFGRALELVEDEAERRLLERRLSEVREAPFPVRRGENAPHTRIGPS